MIGRRCDYTLPDQKELAEGNDDDNIELESETLPPVPMPHPNPGDAPQEENAIPELPPPAEDGDPVMNIANVPNADNNQGNPGDFVANDAVDEGVSILAKMQHGEAIRESQQGVGTRARRKAVKVMCIARCPIGGHFATGSDDGIGRVWADSDDIRVENCDRKMSDSDNGVLSSPSGVRPMFTRAVFSARQRSILGSSSGKFSIILFCHCLLM